MFGKLVNKAKDIGLQFVATWISNKYLNKLGTVTNLQLDTEKQEISLTLDLKGEQTPIVVTLDYQIMGSNQIEIKNVRCSREWLATLANEMIPADKKRLNVPAAVTTALSRLIR